MNHDEDDIRHHRHRPAAQKNWGERASNSDGHKNKSTDVWFYVAIIGFFAFLRFLPWILRKLGCIPQRLVLLTDPGGEENEEPSEEERKKLVAKSLSTTKVLKHSPGVCSGEFVKGRDSTSDKKELSRVSLASTSTDEDVGDGQHEAKSNGDANALHLCHVCLDNFLVGEEISWSNVSKCGHCFHSKCINEWLLRNEACPLCRAKMLDLGSVQNAGGRAEVGQEEVQGADMDAAEVQVRVLVVDIPVENVRGNGDLQEPANEEGLATAEEGRADSTSDDSTGNRQEAGEMMRFCIEHGLRVNML